MAENREKLVPEIRFKGFTDAWVQRKLGDVANVFDGVHQTPKYSDSGIKFVSVENIRNLTGTNKFITVEDYNSQFNNKAEIGDIFMTRITAGIIGETAIVESDEDFAYYVSLALIKLRDGMSSEFINYCINANSFKNELNKRIIHTAFPKKINLNEIGKCGVIYPSVIEQQKIGSFFRTLDKAITLYRRKLGFLQVIKNGYLQQMFPQPGESVPKLRFSDFSDTWVRRELHEVVDFFNEKRIPIDAALRTFGEYPYYGSTGIIDYVHSYIFDGEYVLLAEDGANIINRSSPIAYLTQGKFWVNNHAHIMRMKNGDNRFLLQLLEKQNYVSLNTGTAQPKLNGEVVKKMMLVFPQKEEQTAIGTFFSALDNAITLHKRKLEFLHELKNGYLQRMFPRLMEH